MELRTPITPEDVHTKSPEHLREKLVISNLFQKNQVTYIQSHHDRILIGGVSLVGTKLALEAPEQLRAEYLLQRREMGLVCLEGSVTITIDGTDYALESEDIIYISRGSQKIELNGTAEIYFTSSMCHIDHPTTLVKKDKSDAVVIGDKKNSSERTLRKYIHDQGVSSSSMAMGITTIHEGSVWNTMPPHVHERRSEVYLYTGLGVEDRVFHYMGQPDAMRHILVGNDEAVISPPWSIHMGSGTSAYTFIWAMGGENLDYSDMNVLDICQLK
jgi:4-deoxy-L-threo-5-hexosulose-uronate ketol-isomerase